MRITVDQVKTGLCLVMTMAIAFSQLDIQHVVLKRKFNKQFAQEVVWNTEKRDTVKDVIDTLINSHSVEESMADEHIETNVIYTTNFLVNDCKAEDISLFFKTLSQRVILTNNELLKTNIQGFLTEVLVYLETYSKNETDTLIQRKLQRTKTSIAYEPIYIQRVVFDQISMNY